MSLTDFTEKTERKRFEIDEKEEIFEFISDKRVLRVLFESKIFQLRDIQKEAIKRGLFYRKSFLVCAPSGSGKTLIGELCAIYNVFQRLGKSIYLVPFKALATEKFFAFNKSYKRFKVKVVLSIGDFDVDDSKLEKADIIITTYEKLDSLLRNFYDKDWIHDISTIVIDEIHIIGEIHRGPRLESLIVRLNELLHKPQIIGLSATIANPEFFNSWLSSLGNDLILIKSEKRPVPLHYVIDITQNKESSIKKHVKSVLSKTGQLLLFLNKRKSTQRSALNLKVLVDKFINEKEKKALKKAESKMSRIKGSNKELRKVVNHGVAFHHAGLLPKERRIVEDLFRKKILKVICCTTTLSAGINTPARVVILKDYKKYVTSGNNIKNYSGFFENGDGFSYFMPFSANEVFQMLGRAGRPGLDSVGYGIILVKDVEERSWVEDNYFAPLQVGEKLIPKYNNLHSGLNKINTLKEQVLLRIYEEKKITIKKLKLFFQKTYFWYIIKKKTKSQQIPIEQLLFIKEISPINILKLHSEPNRVKILKTKDYQVKITKISSNSINGVVKTDFGVFSCQFDVDIGIRCSCSFDNGISDNFGNQSFSFEFCDHITSFLLYLIKLPDKHLQQYVSDIVPRSVKNQYILDYLFEKGLIVKNSDDTISCSQFGKLIIRLYLYPVSGVLIREKLEKNVIKTYQELVKEALDILRAEGKVKDYRMLEPILEWTDEEPLDHILERFKIMAGDLNSLRDSLERVITFIGIIARSLSENGLDIQDRLIKVAEMSETLRIRIHYGIKEELFDLVLRLENVARVRARILYNAGYKIASQVNFENPYILNRKTGLGVRLCKKIIESVQTNKKK